MYVTENNRVQKFDSNGKFLTKWGKAGSGDGEFGLALAIAIDARTMSTLWISTTTIFRNSIVAANSFSMGWEGRGRRSIQRAHLRGDRHAGERPGGRRAWTGRLQKFDSNGKFLSWFTWERSMAW